jgi:uncharacterized protein (TIGR00369 family)
MNPKKRNLHLPLRDPKIFRSKINQSPFYKTIKMQLDKTGEKGSLLKIKLGRKHHNALGIVHGGVVAALIDSACSMSVIPHLRDDETIVTTELHIQYYLSITGEDIIGRGRVVHHGRRVVYAEAEIFDKEEKIVAKGFASFLIMKKSADKGE